MSRVKVAVLLGATAAIVLRSLAAFEPSEGVELRDLKMEAWNCSSKDEGTAQSREARERNRMKNRWSVNLSGFAVESLDTASFLKKVREYDSHIQGKHRGDLTDAQREELDASENQIVSLTGWLLLAYPGPPETTNCGDETFHDWHLEIFENPSDHAPQIGDPTPIICEVTPRTEQRLYRDSIRIQSLAGFFRLLDKSFHPMQQKARNVRVTGYLLWDDDHNGSADVGSTVQYFGSNGFHHPWRSTAWEIHPIIKIEAIECGTGK
jgi:hypothetical protein